MDKTTLKSNSSSDSPWQSDALEAVKMDPAVIEAQITVDTNKKMSPEPDNLGATQEKPEVIETKELPKTSMFEEMVQKQKAALLSLAPPQFELLMRYAGILRMQRLYNQKHLECGFCKNNGEPVSWYSTHVLKDNRGKVRCPVLRGYRCPCCGATGDHAHTIKYCPENHNRDRWSR